MQDRMSTPGERIVEALAAIRALGPVLTKLELSREPYAALEEHFRSVRSWPMDAAPWIGVPVYVDRSLPPWSRREHYSDGRVVTRYRLVIDPRALQVAFRSAEYGLRANRGERHGLSLQVRWGRAWIYAECTPGRVVTSSWKGPRVSPYLPGLARLTELAGMKLEPWQQDYLARTLRAQEHASPIVLTTPRSFGSGWTV